MSTASDSQERSALRARVQAVLIQRFPDAAGLRLEGPLQWRINSALFRAQGPALPCPLAVKACFVPHSSAPASDLAQQQFTALSRVHAKMGGDARLNVPRPVLCDPQAGVIGVEWLEGATLTEHLRLGRRLIGAETQLHRAGQWLRRFHDANLLPDTRFDDAHKVGVVQEFAADAMTAEPEFRAGVASLERLLERVARQPHRRSWVHGDYKCDNVFVCDDRLAGIDITLHLESSPVVYDAAQFLNHLALLTHAPTRLYLRPFGGRFERAFIAGYADGGDALDPLALGWVRLFMMLSSWRTHQASRQPGLRGQVVAGLMRGLSKRLRRALETAARSGSAERA